MNKKQPETKANNTNINNQTIITPKIPLAKIEKETVFSDCSKIRAVWVFAFR